MIHTIMKYFLTLLIIFLIGYTSASTAEDDPFLMGLDQRYRQSMLMILEECDDDADWVKQAANIRDGGTTLPEMSYRVIDDAAEQNKTKERPYTTQDVLYRLTLIIWVYDNQKMTPEEIYMVNNNFCIGESTAYLDRLYSAAKKYYKQQKNMVVPIE